MGQNIDPIQTLMLNGYGREVSTVVINVKFVMEYGQIKGIDDRDLRAKAQEQFALLVSQHPDRTFCHPPVKGIFSTSNTNIRKTK